MSAKKRTNRAPEQLDVHAFGRLAQMLVHRVFGRECVLSATLVRGDDGLASMHCTWKGPEWSGTFDLHQEGPRELLAKDIETILKVLN